MTEKEQRAPFEVLEEAIRERRCTAAKVLHYEVISAIDLDRNLGEPSTVKVLEMPEGANAVCGRGLHRKSMVLYTGRRYMVEVVPITVAAVDDPDYLDQLVRYTLLEVDSLFIAMLSYLQENRHPPVDPYKDSGAVLVVGSSVPLVERLTTRSIPMATTNGSLLRLGNPVVLRTGVGWQMTSYIGIGVYATW